MLKVANDPLSPFSVIPPELDRATPLCIRSILESPMCTEKTRTYLRVVWSEVNTIFELVDPGLGFFEIALREAKTAYQLEKNVYLACTIIRLIITNPQFAYIPRRILEDPNSEKQLHALGITAFVLGNSVDLDIVSSFFKNEPDMIDQLICKAIEDFQIQLENAYIRYETLPNPESAFSKARIDLQVIPTLLSTALIDSNGFVNHEMAMFLYAHIGRICPTSFSDRSLETLRANLRELSRNDDLAQTIESHKEVRSEYEPAVRADLQISISTKLVPMHLRRSLVSLLLSPHRQINIPNCYQIAFIHALIKLDIKKLAEFFKYILNVQPMLKNLQGHLMRHTPMSHSFETSDFTFTVNSDDALSLPSVHLLLSLWEVPIDRAEVALRKFCPPRTLISLGGVIYALTEDLFPPEQQKEQRDFAHQVLTGEYRVSNVFYQINILLMFVGQNSGRRCLRHRFALTTNQLLEQKFPEDIRPQARERIFRCFARFHFEPVVNLNLSTFTLQHVLKHDEQVVEVKRRVKRVKKTVVSAKAPTQPEVLCNLFRVHHRLCYTSRKDGSVEQVRSASALRTLILDEIEGEDAIAVDSRMRFDEAISEKDLETHVRSFNYTRYGKDGEVPHEFYDSALRFVDRGASIKTIVTNSCLPLDIAVESVDSDTAYGYCSNVLRCIGANHQETGFLPPVVLLTGFNHIYTMTLDTPTSQRIFSVGDPLDNLKRNMHARVDALLRKPMGKILRIHVKEMLYRNNPDMLSPTHYSVIIERLEDDPSFNFRELLILLKTAKPPQKLLDQLHRSIDSLLSSVPAEDLLKALSCELLAPLVEAPDPVTSHLVDSVRANIESMLTRHKDRTCSLAAYRINLNAAVLKIRETLIAEGFYCNIESLNLAFKEHFQMPIDLRMGDPMWRNAECLLFSIHMTYEFRNGEPFKVMVYDPTQEEYRLYPSFFRSEKRTVVFITEEQPDTKMKV